MSTLRVNNLVNEGGTGPTYAPGHVVQVVTFSIASAFSTTATAWTATNIAATITPKSVNSKIIIQVNTNIYSGNTANNVMATIFRGTTSGINLNYSVYGNGGVYSSAGNIGTHALIEGIDNPATTSPVTYTLAILNVPAGTGVVNLNGTTGIMTLMEVAA